MLTSMDDIVSSPPSPNARKRPAANSDSPSKKPLNLKGSQFMMPTPPDTDESSNASPTAVQEGHRAASPAPSSSALSTIESSGQPTDSSIPAISTVHGSDIMQHQSGSGEPPKKKRKLTVAEKEEQKRQKEAKEQEKIKLKAVREEERRVKEEEKRVKDEEKRRKAEERDAKKREKEVEEEKKAQEKLKKERSQMRLGVFFQKPATPIKQSADGGNDAPDATNTTRRRSLSLETFDDVAEKIRRSASPCKSLPTSKLKVEATTSPSKPVLTDYRKTFLPFELQTHSRLAQRPQAEQSKDDLDARQSRWDQEIYDSSLQEKHDLGLLDSYASLEQHFASERGRTRGEQMASARAIMEQIHGTIQKPIDLTGDQPLENALKMLRAVPMRYLHFHEDVRPPYFGSYTKTLPSKQAKKTQRNPFARTRNDTDYDYDSEAEWEEPEEGEDIGNDEDDEAESLGDAEEMEGFLDDEEDELKNKRRMVTGDLQPVSSGLCWQDEAGKLVESAEQNGATKDFGLLRMEVLLPDVKLTTIDPFSTVYWESKPAVEQAPPSIVVQPGETALSCSMLPPSRPPLQQLPSGNRVLTQGSLIGAAEGEKGPITTVAATQKSKAGRKPSAKTMSESELANFKEAIVGSPLGKADLCKGLKTRFPKLTNDLIKDTLGSHFAQVGSTKAEKKWVYVGST